MSLDFAFCTVASKNVLPELDLLLRSIRMFVGPWTVYVLWHGDVLWGGKLPPAIYLPDNTPFDLKVVGSDKSRVISMALSKQTVLYADCDVLFLGDWKPGITADGITFSRHMSNNEGAVGKYNSGFIGVSDASFPGWWNLQPKECPGWYGDQRCLEEWKGMKYEFPEQQNVGFWRWWDAVKYVRPGAREASPECFRMETRGGQIFYNDAPLLSVHSHFMHLPGYASANAPLACTFNRIVMECLRKSTDARHQQIYQTIMGAGPNV